jgi:hypothetical protein
MGRTLALMLVVGLSVPISKADEKLTPPPLFSTVTPENDWRLAKKPGAQPRKIGVLSYYPNNGGGYTFLDGKDIEFYSLPNEPTTYETDSVGLLKDGLTGKVLGRLPMRTKLFTIGPSQLPLGGQIVYSSQMMNMDTGVFHREDTPIAEWTPEGKFWLFIFAEDRATRLKLKSIVPVLANGSKPQAPSPEKGKTAVLNPAKVQKIAKQAVKNKGELRKEIEIGEPARDEGGLWFICVWIPRQPRGDDRVSVNFPDDRLIVIDDNGKVLHYWRGK